MKYALVIPEDSFREIALSFQEHLFTESKITNEILPDRQIIAFGVNKPNVLWKKLPHDSIVVNLEPLDEKYLSEYYWSILKGYKIWDYTQDNIDFLFNRDIFAELIPGIDKVFLKISGLPPIRFCRRRIVQGDIYDYYHKQDSIGSDLVYLSGKDLTQSHDTIKQNNEIVAFNTLGYFKFGLNQLSPISFNGGIFIKPLDITFTITTCKRLEHFLATMDNFLKMCQDYHLIKEWLCVDDGSSQSDRRVMQTKYPFFKFIFKPADEKGHSKSMNIITEIVSTKYVLQYEDDWVLEDKLWIQDLFKEITENVIQVKLLNQQETSTYGQHKGCVWAKRFNPLAKTNFTVSFQKEIYQLSEKTCYREALNQKSYQEGDYFWPGFTLNPSLYRMDLSRSVSEWERKPHFEFLQAAKFFFKGFKVKVWTDCRCLHLGDDVSAYTLNKIERY